MPSKWSPTAAKYTGVGIELAGILMVTLWIGYSIDRHFQWTLPWGTIGATLLGLAASFFRLYGLVLGSQKSKRRTPRE